MKRKATEEAGDLTFPEPRRIRVEDPNDDPDYQSDVDDIASDEESYYAGTASTNRANGTPLTPLSPARKFPSDLKTIRCTFPDCNKTFNRPARLAAHLRSHNKERPYKCSYPGCDKDYIEEKHLRQHIKGSHTNERAHICTHSGCGKSFMTATRLRRHQAVHEGQERFRCRDFPPCNQSFRKHQTLQRHIRSEHLHVSPFPCDHTDGVSGTACGEGFDSAGALRRHQEREHGEIRFWCEECSTQKGDDGTQQKRVGFTTMVLLQAHIKQSHANCMFCGLQCNGRSDLEQHIESEHTTPKTLEERKNVACTWPGCTKTFTKKSNLNVHIRSFHEGLRFVCGQVDLSGTEDLASWSQASGCGESFATKANLENHIRYVHLKYERPEQTHGLPKAKQEPSSNLLDELTGLGEKSRQTLPCTIAGCNAKFTHNGELEAHLQSQHVIEQALIEQLGRESNPMLSQPPVEFDNMMQDMTNWEEQNVNGEFWIGAHDAGVATRGTQGLDEEWLRDEAEMRRLIQHNELEGLIDPALNGL
ncbi:hypothetical protein GGS26DRAFT_541517 [Hypomontagnella submonticulosa]|nr:hypothetical protein GGS26DRAFT_541517 [Hypomontagnella submonticulosa]